MAVVGVGIDVCEIDRFAEALRRTPGLAGRLFTPDELWVGGVDGHERTASSLAARFAAKEALAKALGAPRGLAWQDAEVVSEASGRPRLEVRGTVAARCAELAVASVHVSLSHDAGVASAVVVLES